MKNRTYSVTLIVIVVIAIVLLVGGFIYYRAIRTSDLGSETVQRDGFSDDQESTPREKAPIIVTLPQSNQRVGSPIIIQGEARVFENTINYRLLSESGEVLAEGFTTADAPDVGTWGRFRGELMYEVDTEGRGVIEVFEESARDGSEIHKVSIPVRYTVPSDFFKG